MVPFSASSKRPVRSATARQGSLSVAEHLTFEERLRDAAQIDLKF